MPHPPSVAPIYSLQGTAAMSQKEVRRSPTLRPTHLNEVAAGEMIGAPFDVSL